VYDETSVYPRRRAGIERMGYHAIVGSSTVGPLEGPPLVRIEDCLCSVCHGARSAARAR
jgi:hypothetical protein